MADPAAGTSLPGTPATPGLSDLDPAQLIFTAIGTRWVIDTPEPLPLGLEARIRAAIADFDRVWSRFRPDSLVSLLAREGGSVPVGPDGVAMLAQYTRLAAATHGAVNPLVGAALEHLGYDASYRLTPHPGLPSPVPTWQGIWDEPTGSLTVREPVLVDVGAIGKGRLVDIVCEILRHGGLNDFTVDAGGDLRHHGLAPLRVALEHPADTTRAVGVVTMHGGALAASAPNRRAWGEGLHHVLDARTGAPTEGVAATWAFAPTAMAADAATTAAFFLSAAQVLEAFPDVTAVVRMPARGALDTAGLGDPARLPQARTPSAPPQAPPGVEHPLLEAELFA